MQRARLVSVGPAPRIALEVLGSGPLVVLLHGIGGNRSNWADQIEPFARHFTVAAWDARGYGASDDYDGPLEFAAFSGDLVRVLDHFAVDRAHLVGQSMGGRISLDFWQRAPQRVASLVLVDTSAGSPVTSSPEKVEEFLALRKSPLLNGRTLRDIAPAVAETLVGPATTPQVRERIISSLAQLHLDSYLKTLDTVTRYAGFPDLTRVDVPVLVVVGEHDRIATPDYATDMARRLRCRCVVLRAAGHISNMDNPDDFNDAVLEFLREHAARADVPHRTRASST